MERSNAKLNIEDWVSLRKVCGAICLQGFNVING